MKLLNDSLYLTKPQWRKLFLATTIMVVALYIVAMVFSLCGSKYFILNYQNEQMDRIQNWLEKYNLSNVINSVFCAIEFFIIATFMVKKPPKWYLVLAFIVLPLVPHYIFGKLPDIYYSAYPFLFYLIAPLFCKKFGKDYAFCLLRLLIAMVVVFILQIMIFIIKSGGLTFETVIFPLSSAFIYALEYDIALSIVLFTIALFSDKEKGDSKSWAISHNVGSFSQTSKKKSRKLSLTKAQKNRLFWLYAKFYLTQLGAFLLLMVLPFVLGKLFEFLMMYFAFALARCLLGFKYSLHFKKETLCITVGAVVFGILSLAVPFFYVVVIMAILLGVGLAVLLHLSYKYKGMFLFAQISKPDKFAELYVLMDGATI